MLLSLVVAIGVIIYFLSKVDQLEKRISRIEQTQGVVSSEQYVSAEQPSAFSPRPIPMAHENPTAVAHGPQSPGQPAENQFVDWIKEDFFVKLGALLLLLAFGWLTSYAFIHNWIGPFGRIALGLMLGVVFMAVGVWRIKTHKHQGGIFTVLGATTVLVTTFAAREVYDMFTPLSALMLMFTSVVFVAFVSVRYDSQKLAMAGLVLGSIAPWFTAAPDPDIAGVFLYILLVAVGTLWVVSVTGWSALTLASMLLTFWYSLPFLLEGVGSADKDTAVIFSFIFVSLYFVANLISLVRRRTNEHMNVHTLTALGSAVFLFVWINAAVAPEWQSLLYIAWAMVFAVGTYIVFAFTANRAAFYLYGGTSIALIGVATAAELQGSVLTIAYLLEIGVLLVAATVLRAPDRFLTRLSFLFIIPGVLSLESVASSAWRSGIVHSDFAVVTITTLVFLVAGVFLYTRPSADESELVEKTATGLILVGAVYVVAWVWLVLHALMSDMLATMFSLFVYTVCGIGLYIYGRTQDYSMMRYCGVGLIMLVVGRLLLIEIWNMALTGKIITFFVVGMLLISTAFIRKSDNELSVKENLN